MTAVSLRDEHVMATYRRWPVELVEGHGCRVVDADGNTYLDLMAGVAVAALGHAHPRLTAAIASQASRLVHVSNLYGTAPQTVLARRLSELAGGMRCFFANSGAEAIECALKLARKWGRVATGPAATEVVAANGSFHGRTFGALAATGQPSKQEPFGPMLEGFTHVPFGDAGAVAGALNDRVAAVLLEPIQGEAGVIVPPDGYLADVRALCDDAGALLIVDEVQTGVARTGTWFAYEREGIVPDVVCLAKGLAGGLPIGACLARPEIAAVLETGDHGSTFGGGPVQCAAALAVIDEIETHDLATRAGHAGTRLMSGLRAVCGGAQVRGRGLLIGIQLPGPHARRVAEQALAHGLLINDATADVVRLTPPLIIGDDEIDEALATLSRVWKETP